MARYSGSVPSADDPSVWVPRSKLPAPAPRRKAALKAALAKAKAASPKAGSLLRRRATEAK